MSGHGRDGLPWSLIASELVGTALLVLVGLSFVILMFGDGSPLPRALPDGGARRAVTGFLFGTTGALIAVSLYHFRSAHHRLAQRDPHRVVGT